MGGQTGLRLTEPRPRANPARTRPACPLPACAQMATERRRLQGVALVSGRLKISQSRSCPRPPRLTLPAQTPPSGKGRMVASLASAEDPGIGDGSGAGGAGRRLGAWPRAALRGLGPRPRVVIASLLQDTLRLVDHGGWTCVPIVLPTEAAAAIPARHRYARRCHE